VQLLSKSNEFFSFRNTTKSMSAGALPQTPLRQTYWLKNRSIMPLCVKLPHPVKLVISHARGLGLVGLECREENRPFSGQQHQAQLGFNPALYVLS